MLGLRSRSKELPLDTLDSVQERVGAFSKREPLAALQELAALMDLLLTRGRIAPGQHYPIVDLLDRMGRPHFRKVAHEYIVGHGHLTRFQEQRVWNGVASYLVQLAQAYRFCLARYEVGARGARNLGRVLSTIAARTMRAYAGRMKWCNLRYTPIEPHQWRELGSVYSLAESAGFSRERLSLYRGAAHDSSIEQEFLRPMMLAVASPGSLAPEQLEVADRLVVRCATHFLIGSRPTESMRYFVDLQSDAGPHRIPLSGRIPGSARSFGAGNAVGELHRILQRLDAGRLTRAELGLTQDFELEVIRATAHHLLRYWSPPLPERRSVRQRDIGHVTVVYGLDEISGKVGAVTLDSPFVSEQETWFVENHSETGLRARVPSPYGRWIGVGSLVAFRAPNDSLWRVGIVRRLARHADDSRNVAVETLARGGAAVTVRPRPAPKEKSQERGVLCLLLISTGDTPQEVMLLSPPGTFSATLPLEMRSYDRATVLIPIELVEAGSDYQLARYKMLGS